VPDSGLQKYNSLSIVIVTWNSADEIGDCIRSIVSSRFPYEHEIIVVDNNSSDGTPALLDKLQQEIEELNAARIDKNMGYTWACNYGIKASVYENVLLLNPDTQITGNALQKLIELLNTKEEYGAAAPQLLNDDGSIQHSVRTLPGYRDMFFEMSLLSSVFSGSKFFARWKMKYFSHNELAEVEQPMAAALMVKKKVLDEVGNMDERFKMFFNDVDLCKKIIDRRYKIIFYPGAKIKHSKGVSIYKDRANMIKIWTDDALEYFNKHKNSLLYIPLAVGLKITGFFRRMYYKFR
jgi:GT2 family glycosyltransferase